MDTLTERLHTWVAAGLMEPDQAARIAAFEGTDGAAAAARAVAVREPDHADRGTDRSGRITLAEAIGYVGAALALGAIALLLGELWRDLLVGGRLALVAVLTAAVFGSGVALRDATSGAMRRLSSVLFTATVAGVGWFAGVIESDVLELSWDRRGVVVASSMLAVAVPLYLWRRGLLLQLATLASLVATATTWLSFGALSPDPVWYGVTVGAVGVAWFVLATGGWLQPRVPAEATGAFVALVGVQIASFDGPRARRWRSGSWSPRCWSGCPSTATSSTTSSSVPSHCSCSRRSWSSSCSVTPSAPPRRSCSSGSCWSCSRSGSVAPGARSCTSARPPPKEVDHDHSVHPVPVHTDRRPCRPAPAAHRSDHGER
jgi:hypothetical protein